MIQQLPRSTLFPYTTLFRSRQFPDPLLEPQHRLRRNPPLRFLVEGEAKAQKLPFSRLGHRTLLRVHLELELRGDESRDALHHPFPGPPAANVNVTIVRIPREPEPAPLQLSIELVEHDVTQQGR